MDDDGVTPANAGVATLPDSLQATSKYSQRWGLMPSPCGHKGGIGCQHPGADRHANARLQNIWWVHLGADPVPRRCSDWLDDERRCHTGTQWAVWA